MTPGLLLPPSAAKPRLVLRCTVPGCGTEFPMEHKVQFVRHCKACANRNADRIEKRVAEIDSNYFTAPADKERYAFYRRRGAQGGRG